MAYKTLLIGLGQIGMGYDLHADPSIRVTTLARAFAEHPDFDLSGGVDSNPARCVLFEQHYRQPSFIDIDEAMKNIVPKIVAIAAPTPAHHTILLQLLKYPGIKAVLCEKPLAYNLDEAGDMVRQAAASGVRLYTNYMRRCDHAVIEIRRRLLSGEIAGPIKGICWYSKGLLNNGSHFLNLLQYWLGDMINSTVVAPGRLWDNHDPEPDVRFRFERGEVYFHAAKEENFSLQNLELIAANGRLRFERGRMIWQKTIPDPNNAGYIILDPEGEQIESNAARIQWAVVDQMSRDLAGVSTSICTGSQGLSTIQALTKVMSES